MTESTKPLKTFRSGMIAASVWPRDGKHGKYGEFSLSRTFRSGEAFKYATTFRARDAEALREVIGDATKWMASEEFEFALNGKVNSEFEFQGNSEQDEQFSDGGDNVASNE